MATFHITDTIYFEMINRAEKYENAYWDCIELENGMAITFALKGGKPYNVEAFDEDDNSLQHDFNLATFELLAA